MGRAHSRLLHVKGLKQGPFRYMLYLIFSQGDGLVHTAGDVSASFPSMQGSLRLILVLQVL